MIPVILVIEPDEFVHPTWLAHLLNAGLARLLKKRGYLVVTAADGEEGLVKAAAHLPQLIIASFMQPGIDGVEIAERLREDEATRNIPLLLLIPHYTEPEFDAWLDASGIRYRYHKPIEPKTFLKQVSNILQTTQDDGADS